jgi:hypothetical protein
MPGLNFIPVQDCTGKGSQISGPFRFSDSKNAAVLTKAAFNCGGLTAQRERARLTER